MSGLQARFNQIRESKYFFPVLVILGLTIIVFAPLIGKLGYYNEDWYHLLFVSRDGPKELISLYSNDRPFMGWLNYFDYLMIGNNLLAWNIYALICKFFVGVGVFWIMRLVWPKQRFASFAVALIVLVYPGFLSQPHAMNYKNYLMEYAMALFSIALTIKWMQEKKTTRKVVYALLSIVLAGAYILIYEFMIGLEATRLLLVLYLLWQDSGKQWKQILISALKYEAAYVLIDGIFVYWRFFQFHSTRAAVSEAGMLSQFAGNPARTLLRIVIETGKDMVDSVIFAWSVPSYTRISQAYYHELGFAVLFAALASALVFGYFWSTRNTENESDGGLSTSKTFMLLGALSTLFCLLTIVVPGRDIQFNGFERYSLHATFGIALLTVGLLMALPRRYTIAMLVFLTGLATATHYLNAYSYEQIWEGQKELWWQVSWRIPQLEGGTVLVVNYPPDSSVQQDYEIYGPANLLFPDTDQLINAQILNDSTVRLVMVGSVVGDRLRDINLNKDYAKTLVMSMPGLHSCLQVIDGNKIELSEREEALIRLAAPYSNIDRIVINADLHTPPVDIFGPEPEHRWCYYYEKASLARQQGDWEAVVKIGQEAEAAGFQPYDRVEWMPFFEAYVNLGMYDQAQELAGILRHGKTLGLELCSTLPEDPWYPGSYDYDTVHALLCE